MKRAANVTPYDPRPDAVARDGVPDIGSDVRSLPGSAEQTVRYGISTDNLGRARQRDHPCLLVTDDLLGEIAEKCRRYGWAGENLRSMERRAQRWQPPELARFKIERKGFTWYGLTRRQTIEELWQTALVAKLTDSRALRDKVLTYGRIADPDRGYPTTRWATDSTAYCMKGSSLPSTPPSTTSCTTT